MCSSDLDALKDFVLADLERAGVDAQPLIDRTRPTTNKNAIVAEGYRLLKVDTLDNRAISTRHVDELKKRIAGYKADAVVFSDFRQFSPACEAALARLSRHCDVVLVMIHDPLEQNLPVGRHRYGLQGRELVIDATPAMVGAFRQR